MSVRESLAVHCNPLSVLDAALDSFVQGVKNHEEQMQRLDEKKASLAEEIASQRRLIQALELETAEIDAEITTLKLRSITYQREHTKFRNAITVVKYQIEKIKENIAEAKANDLKDLEDFEKAIDEITENFRSGPDTYNRRTLSERIGTEKEKRSDLVKKLKEVRDSYEEFNKDKGLLARTDENEELLDCVLPGSPSFWLIEMTKTLDEVISQTKKFYGDMKPK